MGDEGGGRGQNSEKKIIYGWPLISKNHS